MLISCEHGGFDVPSAYRSLFLGRGELLASHRGWDAGALDVAKRIATLLASPLVASTVTRLLVDLNRSPGHPRAFSEITRVLPASEREVLLERYHRPHRDEVAQRVSRALEDGERVVHLGVHSFTPALDGEVRRADLALLYDPQRQPERTIARRWAAALQKRLPHLAIRRNTPYRGRSDGLTTSLRRLHRPEDYVGIEIEVNQRLLGPGGRSPSGIAEALAGSLKSCLELVAAL